MIFELTIIFIVALLVDTRNVLELPDYDYSNRINAFNLDLRQKFLTKKAENRERKKRVRYLEKMSNIDLLSVDGLVHFAVSKKHQLWREVKGIESSFRKALAMIGVKYVYKRDFFWRTWRRIKDVDGLKRTICYRCDSKIDSTNPGCNCGGYWNIEEDPPCPYEIFSVINRYEFCAANYSQIYKTKGSCPSIVKYMDVARTCDNPIETTYQITRDFSVPERSPMALCGGRDFCDITTVYKITKNYIQFQIINSTNDILYSRVMKDDKKNYVCINCQNGKKGNITRDVPTSFDLMPKKKKRENKIKKQPTQIATDSTHTAWKLHGLVKKIQFHTTMSSCKRLSNQKTVEESTENNIVDYDFL